MVEIKVRLVGTNGVVVTRKSGLGLTLLTSKVIGNDVENSLPKEVAYQAEKIALEAIRDWKFEHNDFTILAD